MPKALCLASLAASLLVVAIFLIDLLMGLFGMSSSAPLRYAKPGMDITFVVCGALLAYLSWSTYREQR
jgi:hypothetical protein